MKQGIQQMKSLVAVLAVAVGLAACSAGGSTQNSTTTPGTTTAADLVVAVDKSTINDTGSDVALITVTAVDASRNVVKGATVAIAPDSTALVTVSSTTTNASGIVTGTLSIGSDKSNRAITVNVTSGSIKKSVIVNVTGADLQATPGPATAGSSATVAYRLVDKNSNPIQGAAVAVTLAGAVTTGNTDASGSYVYSYTVPNSSTFDINAVAANVSLKTTITTSSGTTNPATGTVLSASISANPANVQVNTVGSTTPNTVEVRALFLGANNAPIQYARVKFDLDGDVNGIGGTLTSGSTGYVYTDANGVARTTYTPGTRSSGNQALTIRACWSEADFTTACPNAVTTNITVVASGVSVSIFTNGKITVVDTQSIYQIGFAVQVVDSVGQPIQGALVSGSVDLPRYYRGFYMTPGGWNAVIVDSSTSALTSPQVCDNEDLNRNDVVEVYTNGDAEDANGTGKIEPYKADVAIVPVSAGSNITDAFGKAYFLLQYGQNVASWDDFTLTFGAIVQGTEGRASYSSRLPVPADAITATATPPFQTSPYNFSPVGQAPATVTKIGVTLPGSSPVKTASLCQAQP
jgi:hypothetical protein